MHITITGATGHVGANLIPALLAAGHQVRALYRTESHAAILGNLEIEMVRGDILDPGFLPQAFQGTEAVVHLAAVISIDGDPGGRVRRTNIEGTRQVVQACLAAGVRRLVHFSSIDAVQYSKREPVINEDSPLVGEEAFAYRISKKLGEAEVWKGAEQGLETIILAPTAIVGPRDFFISPSGQMLRDLFTNKLPALVADGYDWVDVRDIAQATLAALMSSKPGERYLLSGTWASTPTLSTLCHQVSGRRTPRLTLPLWMAYLGLPFLRLQQLLTGHLPLYTRESLELLRDSSRNFSHAKAARDLRYQPRPLEETIRDTYEWYLEQGEI